MQDSDDTRVSVVGLVVSSSHFSCNKNHNKVCNKAVVDDNVSTSSCSCFLVSGKRLDSVAEYDKIAMIWHNRLDPSTCVLDKVLHTIGDNVTSRHIEFCNSCPLGKSHRLFHGLSNSKAKAPFELVYSDVWEPAPLLSNEGYRYYVIKLKSKLLLFIFMPWLKDSLTKSLSVCKLTGVESIEVSLLFYIVLVFSLGIHVPMLIIKMEGLKGSTCTLLSLVSLYWLKQVCL